jgi:acylphosphatase
MPDDATKRVRARIAGVVQGVFYRASTRDRARALGVTGWVRNRADGSVELEAQGPIAAVERLLAWCRVGPPGARVTGVEVTPLQPHGAEDDFEVRR